MIQFNSSRFLTRVDREAKTLAGAGHEVVLLALKDPDTEATEEREGYVVRRVAVLTRRLPRWTIFKPLKAWEGAWRMFWRAWRSRSDVYDVRDLEPMAIGWLAARMRRAKLVYSSDELCLERNGFDRKPSWLRALYGAYERFFIRRADVVISTDRYRGKELARRYPGIRPIIVRNVSELVKPMPKKAALPELKGRGLRLMIYQGLLSKGRGLEQAIHSLEQLEDFALLIVGYGPLEAELRMLAEELRVSDRVVIREAVPFNKLVKYTAAADAGLVLIQDVCRSYYLCAPNKFYEYMMMGVPVVASDFPEMRDVIAQHPVGVLVEDPSNSRSLVRAVRKMFADEDAYRDMRKTAREVALKRFNWGVEQKGLIVAYERILNSAK
ncbi:MAG: glycosyltransferase [Actinobacteria bacterium]|nr:MAG: glycosyltransferase [Actinomycetota bacterium]